MNNYALKSNIRINTLTSRTMRREATRMLAESRALWAESVSLGAFLTDNQESKSNVRYKQIKYKQLVAQSELLREQGMSLRDTANEDRELVESHTWSRVSDMVVVRKWVLEQVPFRLKQGGGYYPDDAVQFTLMWGRLSADEQAYLLAEEKVGDYCRHCIEWAKSPKAI